MGEYALTGGAVGTGIEGILQIIGGPAPDYISLGMSVCFASIPLVNLQEVLRSEGFSSDKNWQISFNYSKITPGIFALSTLVDSIDLYSKSNLLCYFSIGAVAIPIIKIGEYLFNCNYRCKEDIGKGSDSKQF